MVPGTRSGPQRSAIFGPGRYRSIAEAEDFMFQSHNK